MESTQHDNHVKLNLTGIEIQSFDVTDHSITDGQPYGGVTVSGDDELVVKAGRSGSGSDGVAGWFKTTAKNGEVIGCDIDVNYPSNLNFGIYGTLTFKLAGKIFVVKDLILAQGHNARDRNNWWLGGPHMEGGSVHPIAGAAVATAYEKSGKIPIGKVGFIAPPLCIAHFDLVVVSL